MYVTLYFFITVFTFFTQHLLAINEVYYRWICYIKENKVKRLKCSIVQNSRDAGGKSQEIKVNFQ